MSEGMCFRCEHRARFLEGKGRPRYECGDLPSSCDKCKGAGTLVVAGNERKECHFCDGAGVIGSNKYSCYMYKPVCPVATKVNDGDERPQFSGAMFSARSHTIGVADCMELVATDYADGAIAYWRPVEVNDE